MPKPEQAQAQAYQDCLACRIVGTAALGGVGVYALQQSRPHAPGSVVGKRIMAGLGVCALFRFLTQVRSLTQALFPMGLVGFLVASALRWTK